MINVRPLYAGQLARLTLSLDLDFHIPLPMNLKRDMLLGELWSDMDFLDPMFLTPNP